MPALPGRKSALHRVDSAEDFFGKEKTTAACATVVLNESVNTLSQRLAPTSVGFFFYALQWPYSAFMALPAYLRPLDPRWHVLRDQLRVQDIELVQYTETAARQEAARFRHHHSDYHYGLHKILGIYDNVVHASVYCTRRYSNETLAELAAQPVPKEESVASMAVGSVKDNPLMFLAAAPAAIFMYGMAIFETKRDYKYRRELAARIHKVASEPLIVNPKTGKVV